MGLIENVTYNNYERKGTLQGHSGSSQREESRSSIPWAPPQIENKNKTHKAQQQVPKTKTKKLGCSILKPESASQKFTKQLCKLLQHVLLLKCPGSWNPAGGVHSLLLLEKEWFTSTSTSSPTLLSQSWSACFKLQDFPLFSDPPHSQTHAYTVMYHLSTNHQLVNIHFLLSSSHLV